MRTFGMLAADAHGKVTAILVEGFDATNTARAESIHGATRLLRARNQRRRPAPGRPPGIAAPRPGSLRALAGIVGTPVETNHRYVMAQRVPAQFGKHHVTKSMTCNWTGGCAR